MPPLKAQPSYFWYDPDFNCEEVNDAGISVATKGITRLIPRINLCLALADPEFSQGRYKSRLKTLQNLGRDLMLKIGRAHV